MLKYGNYMKNTLKRNYRIIVYFVLIIAILAFLKYQAKNVLNKSEWIKKYKNAKEELSDAIFKTTTRTKPKLDYNITTRSSVDVLQSNLSTQEIKYFKPDHNQSIKEEHAGSIPVEKSNILKWTRPFHDAKTPNGTNATETGTDIQCEVNLSINNLGPLPSSYIRSSLTPQALPRCGIDNLTRPWRVLHYGDVEMLFLVKTSPKHTERRQIIRQTWGSVQSLQNMRFATIFLVARTGTPEKDELLIEENKIFGDLLQCDFKDSYRNLPVKILSTFRWLSEEHMKSTYYTITDDDCVMNLLNINIFFSKNKNSDVIFCGFIYDKNNKPVRQPSKWKIPVEVYSSSHYPTFCHGGMWTLSKPLIHDMYCLSEVTNRGDFYLEDVYLTGILRQKLGQGDLNIKPVLNENGLKLSVMYYLSDESDTVRMKMRQKWKQLNATLPWNNVTLDGHPMITTFFQKDELLSKKIK